MGSPALNLYDSSYDEGFWVVDFPVQERIVWSVPRSALEREVLKKLRKVGGGAGVN